MALNKQTVLKSAPETTGMSMMPDNPSEDLVDFCGAFEPYGVMSPGGTKLRREGFAAADSNATKMVSLAESENFIKYGLDKLHSKDRRDLLFKKFRRSYIYAFNNAKALHCGDNEVLPGAKTATEDDYVSFSEFRVFTLYLRIYATMFDAFADIDGGSEGITEDDDRRVDRDELQRWFKSTGGGPKFKAFEGVDSTEEVEELFCSLDTDSSGQIIFSEWCASIKEIEIMENTHIGELLSGDIKPTSIAKKASGKVRGKPITKKQEKPATPKKTKKKAMIMPTKVSGVYLPSTQASTDLKDFIRAFQPFTEKTILCGKLRKQAFKSIDSNGNGKCSLAEISQHANSALKKEYDIIRGEELYNMYLPSFIRAFSASKAIAKTGDPNDDNYINFAEFRVLNAYLCIYAGMMDAFMQVDGAGVTEHDDRRIEETEWMKSYSTLSTSSFIGLTGVNTDDNASAIFKSMDLDGRGMVLLSEFCEYIRKKEMENKTPLGKLLDGNALKPKVLPKAT